MKRISTHVLDTTLGRPAKGVTVRLDKRDSSGDWTFVFSARTDEDGRCNQLLPEIEVLRSGSYRICFDTASYYHAQKVDGFYPVVEITFEVREGQTHFHIPLLLSANGYTTYRGS